MIVKVVRNGKEGSRGSHASIPIPDQILLTLQMGFDVKLTTQATVNLTQIMSKTETRSKGFELNIDLSGMENKGVTEYNDNPILPGEKVDPIFSANLKPSFLISFLLESSLI